MVVRLSFSSRCLWQGGGGGRLTQGSGHNRERRAQDQDGDATADDLQDTGAEVTRGQTEKTLDTQVT